MNYVGENGRLLQAGVMRIHMLRGAWDEDGNPKKPDVKLETIATELGVSLGTVHSVCSGKSYKSLHPSGKLFWLLLEQYSEEE